MSDMKKPAMARHCRLFCSIAGFPFHLLPGQVFHVAEPKNLPILLRQQAHIEHKPVYLCTDLLTLLKYL